MVNFIIFALFSSVFVASLRLNNAVPFSGSRDEASAGEYNFYDKLVFFCSVEIDMFPGCFRTPASGISTPSFTFIGTASAKITLESA